MSAHDVLPLFVEVGLTAAIVAVVGEERREPMILVARPASAAGEAALPSGPFDPLAHRTFEIGLRDWVEGADRRQARLCGAALHVRRSRPSFAPRRHRPPRRVRRLPRPDERRLGSCVEARRGRAAIMVRFLPLGGLARWSPETPRRRDLARAFALGEGARPCRWEDSAERSAFASFSESGASRFDDELVLERFELIYEAGLAFEFSATGRPVRANLPQLGQPMHFDHRRILATAMGRLRAKVKYRPVIFELMPTRFTLTELQRAAEAISGRDLHKQNFRRVVETSGVVEATGELSRATGGRPAELYRFRRDLLRGRPAPGLRVGPVR